MNHLTSLMGIISTTASLLMVGILSRLGWTKAALLTPLVLLITSVAFFACMLADTTLSPIVSALLGTTPLALAVLLGSIQNCFSKAAKYSLFDTTKEMAFIPLDKELKLKGKAAIDGIGSRFGKSASSYIHQGLYLVFCSLHASAPYVAIVLISVIVLWISAVLSLGRQFTCLHQQPEELVPASGEGVESALEPFQEPILSTSKLT
jgi:AAA family ATP:ADP antiporter